MPHARLVAAALGLPTALWLVGTTPAAATPLVQTFTFDFIDPGTVFDTNLYYYQGAAPAQAAIAPGAAATSLTFAISGTITGLPADFTEFGNLTEDLSTNSSNQYGISGGNVVSGPNGVTFSNTVVVAAADLPGAIDFTQIDLSDYPLLIDGTPSPIEVQATVVVTADYAPVAVPEPTSLVLLGAGLTGLVVARRRRV